MSRTADQPRISDGDRERFREDAQAAAAGAPPLGPQQQALIGAVFSTTPAANAA